MSNYQEWKIKNPNKTINDYYADHPQSPQLNTPLTPLSTLHTSNVIHTQPQVVYVQHLTTPSVKDKFDMLNILVSVGVIISVLLPWIVAKYNSYSFLKVSGFELQEMINLLSALTSYHEKNALIVNSFYLIPGGACLVLIGEMLKNNFCKFAGQALSVLSLGFWSYFIYESYKDFEQLGIALGYGYLLAMVCGFIYFIKFFID